MVRTTDEHAMHGETDGSQPRSAATSIDWLPSVDILETPTEFQVALDICGVRRDRIDVRLEQDRLTVSGTRAADDEGEVCHYRERQTGRFARAFTFRTPVDGDAIEARLADGVLTLTIPKQVPKKIELQ